VAPIIITILLLLQGRLSFPERLTSSPGPFAVVTFRKIGRSRIFALIEVDASFALENKILVPDLGNEMVTRRPIPKTIFVISQTAALAID
jgi:hypothetical protein